MVPLLPYHLGWGWFQYNLPKSYIFQQPSPVLQCSPPPSKKKVRSSPKKPPPFHTPKSWSPTLGFNKSEKRSSPSSPRNWLRGCWLLGTKKIRRSSDKQPRNSTTFRNQNYTWIFQVCKICAFSPKKSTKRQKFYISGRSRYDTNPNFMHYLLRNQKANVIC